MSQPSWIGHTLGQRYEIQELLGQGGMSAVYKALDPNLKRTVAIKLIHSHLSSDPKFVVRFEEEAAAVAQLRHPNIIQVYDFNNDGDTYYIVFEFVPGESLQDRLRRLNEADRYMPVEETISVAANISDALDYAHKRGMIHRDIKPANVMLNVHGEAILMDFGIVKIMGGESHTATGAVVGTARYMSPEQVRGVQVNARTDIYSMGTMLFEMVGGRPPFEADSAMTLMMMHINDPVPDVRKIRPNVPADLVNIINRSLAKNPEDRYQSAGEMAQALQTVRLDAPLDEGTIVETVPRAQVPQDATILEPTPQVEEAAPTPASAADATYLDAESAEQPAAARPKADVRTAPRPQQPQPAAGAPSRAPAAAPQEGQRRTMVYAGIGAAVLAVICIAAVAIALGSGILSGGDETPEAAIGEQPATQLPSAATDVLDTPEPPPEPTDEGETAAEPTPEPVIEPTDEPTPTDAPPPTETSAPTETPTLAATAAPTDTPAPTATTGPFVQINSVTLNGSTYFVDYTALGYVPALPGTHIHFFFNTVAPENAGVPGNGPWFLYGGPNPFTGYTVNDRPAQATQICALVANPDHSVIQGTGNCVLLP